MKTLKASMVSMSSKHILMAAKYSRASLCHQRIKNKYKKVELFIGTSTRVWTVMMINTKKNFLEHMLKCLKNTLRHLYLFMATKPLLTTLPHKAIQQSGQGFARSIKESICRVVNIPTLNKNICRYNLPHI